MSAVLMKDHPPDEARGSNACNRLHIRRTAMAQGGWTAEPRIVPRRNSLRVLIVDDYRASADTMSMLVGAWGHDVRRAYDGATGLSLAAAYQPDVLLLDIILPEIGGLEMAMQVRRQPRLKDCLLVAVTGRTDPAHRLQCEEAGMDLFLVKPVDLVFLRTLLTVESEYRLQSRHEPKTHHAHPNDVAAAYEPEFVQATQGLAAFCKEPSPPNEDVKHVSSIPKEPRSGRGQRR